MRQLVPGASLLQCRIQHHQRETDGCLDTILVSIYCMLMQYTIVKKHIEILTAFAELHEQVRQDVLAGLGGSVLGQKADIFHQQGLVPKYLRAAQRTQHFCFHLFRLWQSCIYRFRESAIRRNNNDETLCAFHIILRTMSFST